MFIIQCPPQDSTLLPTSENANSIIPFSKHAWNCSGWPTPSPAHLLAIRGTGDSQGSLTPHLTGTPSSRRTPSVSVSFYHPPEAHNV